MSRLKYIGFENKHWCFQLKGKEYKIGYKAEHLQIQFFVNEYRSHWTGIELTNDLLQWFVFTMFHGYLWINYKPTYRERISKAEIRFNLDIISDIDFLGIINREEGWLKQE